LKSCISLDLQRISYQHFHPRARMRVGVRKFRGQSYRSYFGRGLAAPSSMRSKTRPPHSPDRRSAVSNASNSGQTHNDSRLNPSARIFRLCASNRSEFVDATNTSIVVERTLKYTFPNAGQGAADFRVHERIGRKVVEPVERWNRELKHLISLQFFGSTTVPPYKNIWWHSMLLAALVPHHKRTVEPWWNRITL
jgi:hypothetical protein